MNGKMLQYPMLRLVQVLETVRLNSFKKLLKDIVFFNRVAVPVEMDLACLPPLDDPPPESGERLVEIKPDLVAGGALVYPVRSRLLKAENYLAHGYRGFAMVCGDSVSGDIWCATARDDRGLLHPDERWLKIQSGNGEVYSFDMFVNPQKRGSSKGSNIAVALQNGALHQLRKDGFTKAYGFFWADNIPALWVHRSMHWKELSRVRASRFIFSRKFSVVLPTGGTA